MAKTKFDSVVRQLRVPSPAPPTSQDKGSVTSETAMKIVIVEDNSDSREMLTMLLKLDGYDVTAAPDGVRGFQEIAERRPDVAIVDIGLPGMDGYQVARKVRAELDRVPIRLVALTGYGRSIDTEQVLAAGFDEHLIKPVDPRELIRVLGKPR